MDEAVFRIAQTAIDAGLDGWVGRPAGITLGVKLAEEFLRRGLLEKIEYRVLDELWSQRRYRGRVVQVDPDISAVDFYFGIRIL